MEERCLNLEMLLARLGSRSCQCWKGRGSLTLFQDTSQISFPVKNGDHLKRGRLKPVDNGVIRISDERPETQRTAG